MTREVGIAGPSFVILSPVSKEVIKRLLRDDYSPKTVEWICSGGAEERLYGSPRRLLYPEEVRGIKEAERELETERRHYHDQSHCV